MSTPPAKAGGNSADDSRFDAARLGAALHNVCPDTIITPLCRFLLLVVAHLATENKRRETIVMRDKPEKHSMDEQTVRQVVTARFYQSLAQSDIEITAIPQPQLQAIVNALADGVFAALDATETEADHPIAAPLSRADSDAVPHATDSSTTIANHLETEELLWSGRPYLSIGVRYELTTQRVRLIRGLLGRNYHEIELVRVRDTSVTQHLGERALNVGDVTITSNDPSHPEFTLHNVKDPMEVREMIRKATLQERQRRGVHYQEEM